MLWQDQPDGVARMMMWRLLWWIGLPWLLLAAVFRGWLGAAAMPAVMVGAAMVAAPFVMWLFDLQTLFAITNRRALIVRTAWGKASSSGTVFADMDATFDIMDIGRGAGHLNFASGVSTRSPDSDYTGRYGFRCVRDPVHVRDILEKAREAKYSVHDARLPAISLRQDDELASLHARAPLPSRHFADAIPFLTGSNKERCEGHAAPTTRFRRQNELARIRNPLRKFVNASAST